METLETIRLLSVWQIVHKKWLKSIQPSQPRYLIDVALVRDHNNHTLTNSELLRCSIENQERPVSPLLSPKLV